MDDTTTVMCKCHNGNTRAMERIIIDRERIKLDLQVYHPQEDLAMN